MKNILLPTDFSENSWNAIRYAIKLHEQDTCNFHIMHVSRIFTLANNDSPYLPTQEDIEENYLKPSKRQLRQLLKRISELSVNHNIHKFYTISEYNFFIEAIRKHVIEKKIDLIVMGTKGASGLKKIIVGSNTGDVITKVKCTTLAVPESATYQKIKEIAFPTDLALNFDISILNPLKTILETTRANIRIIHKIKQHEKLNIDQTKNKELLEDYFSDFENSFHFLTNPKIESAIQCFIESRDVNLICMVAKNLSYFQQILFHNKVEEMSYHTSIPFLILHE